MASVTSIIFVQFPSLSFQIVPPLLTCQKDTGFKAENQNKTDQ